jgi:hypothetical protein
MNFGRKTDVEWKGTYATFHPILLVETGDDIRNLQ